MTEFTVEHRRLWTVQQQNLLVKCFLDGDTAEKIAWIVGKRLEAVRGRIRILQREGTLPRRDELDIPIVRTPPRVQPTHRKANGESLDEPQKTCGQCRVAKGLTEFSRDAQRMDGLNSKCLECTRANYATNTAKPSAGPVKSVSFYSIVDENDQFLLSEGWSRQRVAITSLDERMLAGNRIRHVKGKDQLGRKENWLVR